MKTVKKSVIAMFLIIAVAFSFGISACKEHGDRIKDYSVLANLGNYDGYTVELIRIIYADKNVSDVEVPLYLGDTYICTLPDDSYKITVNTKNEKLDIRYAYRENFIKNEHLPEIAESARQALNPIDDDAPLPIPEVEKVEGLTTEQVLQFKNAFFNHLYEPTADDYNNIEIKHYLGTYETGLSVAILKYLPNGSAVPAVEVPYFVNGTYICTLPDPSYRIVASCINPAIGCWYLQEAYDGGDIKDGELLIIAERAQNALNENKND